MKNVIFSILIFSALGAAAQSPVLQAAKDTAQTQHKLILLTFSGSDWCLPCIRMEKDVLEKEAFRKYAAAHLVLVPADFPRLKKHQLPSQQKKENDALAEAYNKNGAFPYTVLLDADGQVLKSWDGVVSDSAEGFIALLETVSHGR